MSTASEFEKYDMSLHEIADTLYKHGEHRAYQQMLRYIAVIDKLRTEVDALYTECVHLSADLQYNAEHNTQGRHNGT